MKIQRDGIITMDNSKSSDRLIIIFTDHMAVLELQNRRQFVTMRLELNRAAHFPAGVTPRDIAGGAFHSTRGLRCSNPGHQDSRLRREFEAFAPKFEPVLSQHMMPGSDCDCANMTLGEVDYILGEPESNNYVLNTTTLYGVIFEQRDKISVRKKKVG